MKQLNKSTATVFSKDLPFEDPNPKLVRNMSVQGSTRLRCEVVSDFRRLQQLSPQWTRLWKSDSQAEIFQTPEWAAAWWRTFGHNLTLCTLVVFAADEVIGIVPLVKRGAVIRLLGTPEADYADIICEDGRAEVVLAVALETLRESVPGWSECIWQNLSKDSRVMRYYRSLPAQVLGHLQCLPSESYQTILLGDEREAVFSSLLGKKHTRRRRNKLQKIGQVRFRHLPTQEEQRTYLEDFFRHHVRRHAALGKRSIYAAPEACQFIRNVFATLGSAARFAVLELDGRPLAWCFGFEVNGKFLLYQHTFDLDASGYTPGELMLWNLFDYAQDHVAREFDFGKGSEVYKNRFANYSRETFSLFIEPFGMKGRTRGLARSVQASILPYLWSIRQVAKNHSPTLRAVRSVRRWISKVGAWIRHSETADARVRYNLQPTEEKSGSSVWGQSGPDVLTSQTHHTGVKAR